MSVPFIAKGQTSEDIYLSRYVSALEHDLAYNDGLYRVRRFAEFEQAVSMTNSGYATMPKDSVASFITLLESHDTLSQNNLDVIAGLKAYQDRLAVYNEAYAVSCTQYDSLAVAIAVDALDSLKTDSLEGQQCVDIQSLKDALGVFAEQSAMVREVFNVTDARTESRIKLYRRRQMDAVLAKSLSKDFLEPWFVTDVIKSLNADSPVAYIRKVTGRMMEIVEQMQELDATTPAGTANNLLEELLAFGEEL